MLQPTLSSFDLVCEDLTRLYIAKSAVYGHSWRKHGELISIFANISRKVDRLEITLRTDHTTPDESVVDTVADLAVYSLLYYSWLTGHTDESDEGVSQAMQAAHRHAAHVPLLNLADCELEWRAAYTTLEAQLIAGTAAFPLGTKATLALNMATAAIEYLTVLREFESKRYASWAWAFLVEVTHEPTTRTQPQSDLARQPAAG